MKNCNYPLYACAIRRWPRQNFNPLISNPNAFMITPFRAIVFREDAPLRMRFSPIFLNSMSARIRRRGLELHHIIGDIATQTRCCFENIQIQLAEVGGELADIVSITAHFTDRPHLPVIQQVRSQFLSPETAPASTSMMVAGLGHEDFLVELTPIAVIPHD